jgi:hypothetical protein
MDNELNRGDVCVVDRWAWHGGSKGKPFRYRIDTVPGIHHRRYHCGDGYRYPRTTAELRGGYIADEDDYAAVSAANVHKLTAVRYLPHAWDDIPRGNWGYKSWKQYRSSQYHPVVIDGDPFASIAQLVERNFRKVDAVGSIPSRSSIYGGRRLVWLKTRDCESRIRGFKSRRSPHFRINNLDDIVVLISYCLYRSIAHVIPTCTCIEHNRDYERRKSSQAPASLATTRQRAPQSRRVSAGQSHRGSSLSS